MQVYKRKEDNIIFPYLQQNLKTQTVIVDVGARKGNWYKNIAKFFPDSVAHLFEPTPNIVSYTKRKFNKEHQHIYQIALSNEECTLDFHIDLELGGWSGLTKQRKNVNYQTIQVEVRTLDSFKFKNVGLIKIDVEGNELKTLQGATNTIKSSNPIIYFECADVHMINYDYDSGDIFDFFENINYNILDLDLNVCNRNKLLEHTASKLSFYHNFIAKPK
jgi:FkbM family methyltransferase